MRSPTRSTPGPSRADLPAAGALPHQASESPAPESARATATHCPYCALQCGVELTHDVAGRGLALRPDASFPVNQGALCIKGWTAAATLDHPDRLRTPLARDAAGSLVPVSWDDALDRVAAGLRRAQERHGRDAAGIFGGGSLTNEKVYLLGKFARVALGTSRIDYNGRFCMSSAAAASIGVGAVRVEHCDDVTGGEA